MAEEAFLVDRLVHSTKELLSPNQKLSDKVARFGGSWTFINSQVPCKDQFNPFPFILMNLVLSCIAALQAHIIMMSQNIQ